MARPGRPERNRTARSFRQLRRFHHGINSNKGFGTHNRARYETTKTIPNWFTSADSSSPFLIDPDQVLAKHSQARANVERAVADSTQRRLFWQKIGQTWYRITAPGNRRDVHEQICD